MEKFVIGKRLAWYRSWEGAGFWDRHWSEQRRGNKFSYDAYEAGKLDEYERLFTRYLPTSGRILEAGCGLSQYVLSLRARGYQVEGVDLSIATIREVKDRFPFLPLFAADVTRLPVSDESYNGYISLGVVEHRKEGPEPYLHSAFDVLKSGGIAIISVPHFSLLRSIKMSLRFRKEIDEKPSQMEFYQYAFTVSEFRALIEAAGFRYLDRGYIDRLKGIRDEYSTFRRWYDKLENRWIKHLIWLLLEFFPCSGRLFGHMQIVVATKD